MLVVLQNIKIAPECGFSVRREALSLCFNGVHDATPSEVGFYLKYYPVRQVQYSEHLSEQDKSGFLFFQPAVSREVVHITVVKLEKHYTDIFFTLFHILINLP